MRIKLFFLLVSVFCLFNMKASAIPVFYSNGNTVTTVKEMPNTEDFELETKDGTTKHCDLGVMHQELAIFGIPVLNYGDYKYVLFHDNGDSYDYITLGKDEIKTLQSLYSDISDNPELPFWNTIGGKLLVLGVLALFIVGNWFIKNNDSESEANEAGDSQS